MHYVFVSAVEKMDEAVIIVFTNTPLDIMQILLELAAAIHIFKLASFSLCFETVIKALFSLQDIVKDPCSDKFVDRLYCCHLFHRGCLDAYMKKPPFTGECNAFQ